MAVLIVSYWLGVSGGIWQGMLMKLELEPEMER
jgi:hypothetical protein